MAGASLYLHCAGQNRAVIKFCSCIQDTPAARECQACCLYFALGVPEKAKINGFSQVQFCGLRLQNSRDFFQIHPNTLIIPQGKGDKPDFDGHKRKKY